MNHTKFSVYEDCIELQIPTELEKLHQVNYNWHQYNPRKPISRFGCSITSLDGDDKGIPDLDSVMEYNKQHGTRYSEKDFFLRTKHSDPFDYFLNNFQVGRSHYIKLEAGGFFPWHRDADTETFRVIYTVANCNSNNLIWLEDDRILKLDNHKWYYINTKKKHCLFAFDSCIFAVFNVMDTDKNMRQLSSHMIIR
jgi:hypothetical protein